MPYRSYLKQLCQHVLSSSAVLGLIIGIAVLIAGEGSMNLDMDFDFGALDGFTVIVGLPLLSILLFALLSPLSFWVHKFWSKP